MTSRNCMLSGQVYCWICDGEGKPALDNVSLMLAGNGVSSNVLYCGTLATGLPDGSVTLTSWSVTVELLPPTVGFRDRSAMLGNPPGIGGGNPFDIGGGAGFGSSGGGARMPACIMLLRLPPPEPGIVGGEPGPKADWDWTGGCCEDCCQLGDSCFSICNCCS